MKHIFLVASLCSCLTACQTTGISGGYGLAAYNPFQTKETTESDNLAPSAKTELAEIEMLTGEAPELPKSSVASGDKVARQDHRKPSPPQPQTHTDTAISQTVTDDTPAPADEVAVKEEMNSPSSLPERQEKMIIAADTHRPVADIAIVMMKKPLNIRLSDIRWAAAPAVKNPASKPAPENFAETRRQEMKLEMHQQQSQQAIRTDDPYVLQDATADIAYSLQESGAQSVAEESAVPQPEMIEPAYGAQQTADVETVAYHDGAQVVEPVRVAQAVMTDETPLYTADDLTAQAKAKQPSSAKTNQNANGGQGKPAASGVTATASPKGCPKIVILPEARSLTHFDESGNNQMTARASITDVRGGCGTVNGGMEIDLDILMNGNISDKGRFEGNRNAETFMTFPYFVTITSPDGQMVDKKILATAMRFEPVSNTLSHAEKITQFVPMANVALADQYVLTVGYQLTRKQLEYNRAQTVLQADNTRTSPDIQPVKRRSYNPLANDSQTYQYGAGR